MTEYYPAFLFTVGVTAGSYAVGSSISKAIPSGNGLRRKVRAAFRAGLALRIVCAVMFHTVLLAVAVKGKPGFYFDDERNYHKEAKIVAAENPFSIRRIVSLREEWGDHFLYRYVNGCIYYLFGENRLLLRLFGAAFASLLIPIAARIALMCGTAGPRLAFISAWLVALCPLLILYSMSIVRDWAITLTVSAALFFTLQLFDKPYNVRSLSGIAVCTALFFNLRNMVIPLFLAACALWYLVHLAQSPGRSLPRITIAAAALVAVLALTGSNLARKGFAIGGLDDWREEYEKYALNLKAIARSSARMAGHGTFLQFEQNPLPANEDAVRLDPMLAAIAGVRSILEPSPLWLFAVIRPNTVIFFLPGLFWYCMLPLIFVGIPRALARWSEQGRLVVFVALTFFLVTLSTIGVAIEPMRARLQVLPLFYIIAAQGFVAVRENALLRREILTAAGIFYTGIAAFYFFGTYLPWPVFHPFSIAAMAAVAGAVALAALRSKRI